MPAELDSTSSVPTTAPQTPAAKAWLARHPRFHKQFTPTGSSWINQVERWFGLLTDKKIRRGAHKSVQALEADIRAWITGWNNNPRPFFRIAAVGFLLVRRLPRRPVTRRAPARPSANARSLNVAGGSG
ncbi:hypothetical protein Vau01_064040 [Virgisporangium aurantiacum]|uniref:Tc1-like transposase DDE domain-containing protein n=1 Tax=Virgisporangium aurantiacum TaxID=175570 RepID=A0A8J4E2G9_9ACTN|nr:hypothetical protein [Virgisporangium aurantiacum]GIJ58888.1 hypothetical protein Vau01_064040 [Virgisporangium aurantiacum]